jgi:hypothetical protein
MCFSRFWAMALLNATSRDRSMEPVITNAFAHYLGIGQPVHFTLHGIDQVPAGHHWPGFLCLGCVIAAYHIQYHINAFTIGELVNGFAKFFLFIVDGFCSPKSSQNLHFSAAACGNINGAAQCCCHLYGRYTNTAAAAMHQQAFARLQVYRGRTHCSKR